MKRDIHFWKVVLTVLFFISTVAVPLQAAIPAGERAALIALYNATNGDNWTDNSGWKTPPLAADGFAMPGREWIWHDVTVEGDHVTKIRLSNNNLTGSIPAEIGNLSNLEWLILRSNQLSGSIPVELGNLSNLELLWLSNNQLSGSIPTELGNLSNLRGLELDYNQLSGSIPAALGNLSNLSTLYLSNNQLSGSIPTELGNLSNLKWLSLRNNELSGSIPAELGNLSYLTGLWLYSNQLSGSIPTELGNLSNLEWLILRSNQLSGSIPTELGNLTNLQGLYLYSNQLSGSIPTELGNLSNLEWLRLNNNGLSGQIPSSLTNLTNIGMFDISYNCLSATDPTLRAWLNTNDPDWEAHQNVCGGISPRINLNRTKMRFTATLSGTTTNPQEVWITNIGSGTLNWTAGVDASWLTCTPMSGTGSGVVTISVDRTGLAEGTYNGTVTLTAPDADNSPQTIAITLGMIADSRDAEPFGEFSTPITGSTVSSSIPVTGWALDDVEVESVKIYRGIGQSLVYIGEAAFVEGARPDVKTAYPDYPNNSKAGWGYMLLTNFLPNGGNGEFTLHAVAVDVNGKTTTLGTKSITADNVNAIKPFGAIDTPTQGGTVSGYFVQNCGWALTPPPNSIPFYGSSIKLWIDGVEAGHPTYGFYREDIAELFPGYANSDGAMGRIFLDTTVYDNGVHTIQWTVEDSAGNSDGIGSRYFVIKNARNREQATGKRRGNPVWLPGPGI
ncbi:MAG: hypothetical protein GY950_16925, partial [bacterium]|nr:hypothetical protein [bacterium]